MTKSVLVLMAIQENKGVLCAADPEQVQ